MLNHSAQKPSCCDATYESLEVSARWGSSNSIYVFLFAGTFRQEQLNWLKVALNKEHHIARSLRRRGWSRQFICLPSHVGHVFFSDTDRGQMHCGGKGCSGIPGK